MIKGIGPSGPGRIDPNRAVGTSTPKADAHKPAKAPAPASPAADLAASGPPIDSDKVATIKAAIAEGRYTIDPDAIAAKMIELDLGRDDH